MSKMEPYFSKNRCFLGIKTNNLRHAFCGMIIVPIKNKGGTDMDFTLIEQQERGANCYKLMRATFYRSHYVIIVQSKHDFACSSFQSERSEAIELFRMISESDTEPYTLADIISDHEKSRELSKSV